MHRISFASAFVLSVAVAASPQPEASQHDAVMEGFRAVRDAPVANGRVPLVVLSHGWQGNRTNQAWLAVRLAARGAVVVAIDHYRIAVIGHSMGGHTAMAVAGARLDMRLAAKDCLDHPHLAV